MTAHGPEARRLVGDALTLAGIEVDPAALIAITGHALNVIEGKSSREGAIYGVASAYDLDPRHAAKLIDLAIEALTNTAKE